MSCRRCGRAKVNRPRGLCWPCYHLPGVRDLFPSTSKYARRGTGHENTINGTLPAPTTARPGSPEKMAVLAERAQSGQMLWHPADATE